MDNKEKYVVIGGQYINYCYGTTDTLLKAKRMATKHQEYWDNWQGWNTPRIYSESDTKEVFVEFYSRNMRVPKPGALPLYVKRHGKWCE